MTETTVVPSLHARTQSWAQSLGCVEVTGEQSAGELCRAGTHGHDCFQQGSGDTEAIRQNAIHNEKEGLATQRGSTFCVRYKTPNTTIYT